MNPSSCTDPSASGKPTSRKHWGHLAVRRGADVRFLKTSRALADLAGGHADRTWPRRLSELTRPALLILDDFAMRELTAQQADDLYELISERAQNGRSLIATSNRSPADWYPLSPNPVVPVTPFAEAVLTVRWSQAAEVTSATRGFAPGRFRPIRRRRRALRLSRQERDHLFRLAGHADTTQEVGPSEHVPPGTLKLLDRLGDAGVLVLSADCQVLAWNPLAAALFEDFSVLGAADRNIVRRYFLQAPSDRSRYGIGSARRFAGIAVSYLRLAATRYPNNLELRTLISDLIAGSAEFAELWHAQEMRIEHHSEEVLDHPVVGRLKLDFDILSVPEEDQQVVIFTADRDSSEYRALQLLNVIGTQDMTPDALGHGGEGRR